MLREINRLLSVYDGHLMSYDTMFQLGDFYLLPLLFRNVLFSTSPVMPVGFLLHDKKLKNCHEEIMRVMASHLPSLVDGNNTIPLVTDDKKGFAAIENNVPKICRLLCWNHLISAVKFWLRKHGATYTEVPVYVSDIRELLHQASASEYECQLEKLKLNWSESFYCHYMKELDEKVT